MTIFVKSPAQVRALVAVREFKLPTLSNHQPIRLRDPIAFAAAIEVLG